jgi:hypothetical protein
MENRKQRQKKSGIGRKMGDGGRKWVVEVESKW